jgi:hypothetical protein
MQRWVTPDVRAPVLPVAVTPLQRSLSEGALFFSGQRPYARADVLIQDQQQRPTRLDWIPRGSSPGELVRILDTPGKQPYCLAGSGASALAGCSVAAGQGTHRNARSHPEWPTRCITFVTRRCPGGGVKPHFSALQGTAGAGAPPFQGTPAR